MTSRPQVRYPTPVWPFAVFALFAVALVAAAGFSYWERGGSGSNSTSSAALSPSLAPAQTGAVEALAVEMAAHEAWTEAQFGPLTRQTVLGDDVMAALREHENALAAILGETFAGEASDGRVAAAIAEHDAAFPPPAPDR